jgi:glycosyltransferase involved in cell wall biosynthesis
MQLLELARGIDRDRFDPMVFALSGGGALEPLFARAGVPVTLLAYDGLTARGGAGFRAVRQAAACALRLASLLRRERATLLHAFLPAANLVGAVAGAIAGTPVRIVSKRALSRDRVRYPYASAVESLANRLSHAILANSEAVAADVRAREQGWEGKIRVIRNGVRMHDSPPPADLPWAHPLPPPGAAVVACVGNLYPYKGHDILVEAAPRILAAFPETRFLIAGEDRGAMPAVRARIDALGLSGSFCLAGLRDDVPSILARATILAHPSFEEGLPNAVLEAMSAGKPVVATAVGGTPDAVVDGETGLLVPPADPEALAEAVISLLRDPSRIREMGDAGRRRARSGFSLEGMVRDTMAVYLELASRKAG